MYLLEQMSKVSIIHLQSLSNLSLGLAGGASWPPSHIYVELSASATESLLLTNCRLANPEPSLRTRRKFARSMSSWSKLRSRRQQLLSWGVRPNKLPKQKCNRKRSAGLRKPMSREDCLRSSVKGWSWKPWKSDSASVSWAKAAASFREFFFFNLTRSF